MQIQFSAKNVNLNIKNTQGERVLDIAYDNYTLDLDLTKGAGAITELVEKFAEMAKAINTVG